MNEFIVNIIIYKEIKAKTTSADSVRNVYNKNINMVTFTVRYTQSGYSALACNW